MHLGRVGEGHSEKLLAPPSVRNHCRWRSEAGRGCAMFFRERPSPPGGDLRVRAAGTIARTHCAKVGGKEARRRVEGTSHSRALSLRTPTTMMSQDRRGEQFRRPDAAPTDLQRSTSWQSK